MKKWVAAVSAVAVAALAGIVIHQVLSDLSSNARLWTSVTDDPWAQPEDADVQE